MLGFAFWATAAFGGALFEYRTVFYAFMNLFGVLFRDFDYASLEAASPYAAVLFFISFMVVIALVVRAGEKRV